MQIDEDKLNALMGKVVGEFGALASAPLVILGDRLGLYKAMAGRGPMTPDQLSEKTQAARSLRPGVAQRPGGERLRRLRPARPDLRALSRGGDGVAEEDSPTFMGGG
jgi:hypothetical protein